MHLVREVTWRDYRAIYEEFDQVARFAELTPADRHMFWVEQCQAGFPSRAAAKALGHPIDTEPWREWPVPIHAFLGDPYYVGTNVVVRPAVGEFLGDFFDEGAGRSARAWASASLAPAARSASRMRACCCSNTSEACFRKSIPKMYSLNSEASILPRKMSAALSRCRSSCGSVRRGIRTNLFHSGSPGVIVGEVTRTAVRVGGRV